MKKPPLFLSFELKYLKLKLARGYLKLRAELGQTCSGPLQILGTGVGVSTRETTIKLLRVREEDSRGTLEEPMEEPWLTLL